MGRESRHIGEWIDVPAHAVFTLRRQEGMTDAEFERDSAAVAADLATLKSLLE
ncbi:MAG TPA: hypothetical protein VHC01_10805 [Gaiellaceae bacterium]|jgi:hypothetical protein|nr:hypothetical protein [Gaiellaceae bacterium]